LALPWTFIDKFKIIPSWSHNWIFSHPWSYWKKRCDGNQRSHLFHTPLIFSGEWVGFQKLATTTETQWIY